MRSRSMSEKVKYCQCSLESWSSNLRHSVVDKFTEVFREYVHLTSYASQKIGVIYLYGNTACSPGSKGPLVFG